MNIFLLFLFIVVFYFVFGLFIFFHNYNILKKSWFNKKYLRCILFSLFCGPIPFSMYIISRLYILSEVLTCLLLQELPDTDEK